MHSIWCKTNSSLSLSLQFWRFEFWDVDLATECFLTWLGLISLLTILGLFKDLSTQIKTLGLMQERIWILFSCPQGGEGNKFFALSSCRQLQYNLSGMTDVLSLHPCVYLRYLLDFLFINNNKDFMKVQYETKYILLIFLMLIPSLSTIITTLFKHYWQNGSTKSITTDIQTISQKLKYWFWNTVYWFGLSAWKRWEQKRNKRRKQLRLVIYSVCCKACPWRTNLTLTLHRNYHLDERSWKKWELGRQLKFLVVWEELVKDWLVCLTFIGGVW